MKMTGYTMAIVFFVIYATCWTSVFGHSYQTFIMEEQCNSHRTVNIQTSAVKLFLTKGYPYRTDLNCQFTFVAPPGKELTIAFNWMNIHRRMHIGGCGRDRLSLFNGHSSGSPSLAGPLCGYPHWPNTYRTTRGGAVTFLMQTAPDVMTTRTGFEATVTVFNDGPCHDSDDYRCNNNRCIHKNLKCDGNDNCGDTTDEGYTGKCKYRLTTGAIIGIVIACVVVVGMFVIAAILCCKSQQRQKAIYQSSPGINVVKLPTQGVVASTTTSYPMPTSVYPGGYTGEPPAYRP